MVAGESDQWLYGPIVASNRLSGRLRSAEQNKPGSTVLTLTYVLHPAPGMSTV